MSRIARKGLSVTLLVCMLAAPVAAAAPMERSEGRERAAVAGWVSEVMEWVGGWLTNGGLDQPSAKGDGPRQTSAASSSTGGSNADPNG